MKASFDLNDARELDVRASDGVEVRLLWRSWCDRLAVEVTNSRRDERFLLAAQAGDALDAFNHPFGYAARIT